MRIVYIFSGKGKRDLLYSSEEFKKWPGLTVALRDNGYTHREKKYL